MKDITNHLKLALPLYLYPFRVPGLGSFDIGVSIFNLLLPLIILVYYNSFMRVGLKPLFFIIYFLSLSILKHANFLSATNFVFSYLFIVYYMDFVKHLNDALKHFVLSTFIMSILSLFLYLLDVLGLDLSASTSDAAASLHIPRLNGIFLEPSHASLIFALLFSSLLFFRNRAYFQKVLVAITFILTQSAFGFLLLAIINLKRYLLVIGVIFAFYFLINIDLEILFQNSGGVRLYGFFYMLNNFRLIDVLFGNGSGYGIKFFSEFVGPDFGLELFNGFFAELILDIGLFGIILMAIFIPKIGSRIDFALFFILLLFNFGFTVSLFPFLLGFICVYRVILKNKNFRFLSSFKLQLSNAPLSESSVKK